VNAISLSELARALQVLAPRGEAMTGVGRSLGFDFAPEVERSRTDSGSAKPVFANPPSERATAMPSRGATTESSASRRPSDGAKQPLRDAPRSERPARPARFTELEPVPPQAPDWLADALRAPSEELAEPPAPEPLLEPRWTQGILAALLSTTRDDGPVDVDRAIARLARGETIAELPLQPRVSLDRGVQLLIDVGDGMLPFAADQLDMLDRVRRTVGASAAEVLWFRDAPLRGLGSGEASEWGSYRPPRYPQPVLLLSDLGVGRRPGPGRASAGEWLAFAEIAGHARCPILALVPYAVTRVPSALRAALQIVPWDRGTSGLTVSRAR
jgi:hypothetical protein